MPDKEKLKKIPVPKESLYVFVRPNRPWAQLQYAALSEALKAAASTAIIMVPFDTDVIVVKPDGETKVY